MQETRTGDAMVHAKLRAMLDCAYCGLRGEAYCALCGHAMCADHSDQEVPTLCIRCSHRDVE